MNKPTPKIYRTATLSSYNQASINGGNILIWFDEKTQWYTQSQGKYGRNQTYSNTAIQCCLMIKSLLRLSLCRIIGFVLTLIKLFELDWTAEGEWKRKKHGSKYRRQWRKLHIAIDAETLQIRAVQLTMNNVSDSQVLGDLLDQIPSDEWLD